MTLKQLEAFYWAATLGSFAIAADRLAISQSSLSKRLAELEQALGVALFDRSARRAVVTDVGQMLLAGAKQMLALEAELRERISRRNELSGILRFGMGELSAATWFPLFVKRIAQVHPGVVVEPTVSQARVMEVDVERGELDCAVIAGSPIKPQLGAQSLGSIRFAWMASPRLDIGRSSEPLHLATLLSRHPLIAPNALSGQLQGFSDWLVSTGVTASRVIRCNSLNAVVEMTIAGEGVSLLPRDFLMPVIRRKLIVEVNSEPAVPLLSYAFIWRSDDVRQLTASARAIVSEQADFTLTTPLWETGRGSRSRKAK